LKDEIEKIDKLLDYDFLKQEILLPAITHSIERKYITDIEAKILKRAVEKPLIQASDIKDLFVGQDNAIISRQIKKLIEKKMLSPEKEGARKYMISFNNNFLLRGIIYSLGEKGFLPFND
jgi:Fic family protein